MTYRFLEKQDAERIFELESASFRDGWNFLGLTSAFNGGRYFALGVFDSEKLVAFIGFSISIETADIETVCTKKEYRKQGLGTELIVRAEKFLKEKKIKIGLASSTRKIRVEEELNIANLLYKNGIPYKYECPLILSTGEKIHPDFTVLDVKRRRVVYWEHRGMMDKDTYWPDAVQRVKKYGREGIILGQGLIITEETRDIVLGTSEIERIIHAYFD